MPLFSFCLYACFKCIVIKYFKVERSHGAKPEKGVASALIGSYGNNAALPLWLANVSWRCKLAMLATTMAKEAGFKHYDNIELNSMVITKNLNSRLRAEEEETPLLLLTGSTQPASSDHSTVSRSQVNLLRPHLEPPSLLELLPEGKYAVSHQSGMDSLGRNGRNQLTN